MPVLSRTQATDAAAVPAFRARVRSAMLDVAVDVHGGPADYSQAEIDARNALAAAVCKAPTGYADVFAAVIAANEWTGSNDPWVVPGAGDGSDPLINDAALHAGVAYAWDTIANTPVAAL